MSLRARVSTIITLVACTAALAACSSSTSSSGSSTVATTAPSTAASSSSTAATGSATPLHATSSASSAAPTSSSSAAAAGPAGGAVPKGFVPSSATFVSADDGWVLGTAPCSSAPCTSIVRTRDGGRTWQGIPAPRASLGLPTDLRDAEVGVLRFADDSNGWAGVNSLFATHDGGATWHHIVLPGLSSNSAVSSIATGGGYAFASVYGCRSEGANDCRFSATVWASPIGSDSWRRITPALSKANGGLVVSGAHWFLPGGGHVYRGNGTSYTGAAPDPCTPMGGVTPAPVLAVADSMHLDAVCTGNGAAGSAQYQLYGTTDAGAHWTKAGPKHVEPSALYFAADNGAGVLLLATASGGSQLLRTTNDGTTFGNAQVSVPGGGGGWTDLGFTTSSQAFAVYNQKIMYLSRDSGTSFERVDFG